MQNICQKTNCFLCCKNTNMHLTHHDIEEIERYNYHTFYHESPDGWIQLNNHKDRCIFHDGTKCTIYTIRPQGCRLYPLVFNIDDHQPTYDSICPHPECFPITREKTQEMQTLIDQLFQEKKFRQQHQESARKRNKP
jgi:Fe-S-cluster containining protein